MLRSFYNFISVPCLIELNEQFLNDRSKILWDSFDERFELEHGDIILKFQYLLNGLIFSRYNEYFYYNRINDGRIIDIFNELSEFLNGIFSTYVEYNKTLSLTENFINLRSEAMHAVNHYIDACFDEK